MVVQQCVPRWFQGTDPDGVPLECASKLKQWDSGHSRPEVSLTRERAQNGHCDREKGAWRDRRAGSLDSLSFDYIPGAGLEPAYQSPDGGF